MAGCGQLRMAWNQPGVILFSLHTQDGGHAASPVQLSCRRAWLAPWLQRAEPLDGSPEAAHTAAVVNELSDCIRQVGLQCQDYMLLFLL